MSAAWDIFTRSVSPAWTFSSFWSASLMTTALKVWSAVLFRRGSVSPPQKVKKPSETPRMFTFDARVCVCGATIVPFSKMAGTVFCRFSMSGGKNRSARRACWIVPSRSSVKLRRLPRTESPTINAPASTPVATAVQSATTRCICQKYLKEPQGILRIACWILAIGGRQSAVG